MPKTLDDLLAEAEISPCWRLHSLDFARGKLPGEFLSRLPLPRDRFRLT